MSPSVDLGARANVELTIRADVTRIAGLDAVVGEEGAGVAGRQSQRMPRPMRGQPRAGADLVVDVAFFLAGFRSKQIVSGCDAQIEPGVQIETAEAQPKGIVFRTGPIADGDVLARLLRKSLEWRERKQRRRKRRKGWMDAHFEPPWDDPRD